jgi:hypothetical protein
MTIEAKAPVLTEQSAAPPKAKDGWLADYNGNLTRLNAVLGAYAQHAAVVFDRAGCLPRDPEALARFVGLIELFVRENGIPGGIALFYVRDFALAETELENLHLLRERLLENGLRAYLSAKIEAGLCAEGCADHEIKEQTRLLRGQYLQDTKLRYQLMSRFNLLDLIEIEAEVARSGLGELAKLDQLVRNQEKRRDQALKNLAYCNRLHGQFLRELARTREEARQTEA